MDMGDEMNIFNTLLDKLTNSKYTIDSNANITQKDGSIQQRIKRMFSGQSALDNDALYKKISSFAETNHLPMTNLNILKKNLSTLVDRGAITSLQATALALKIQSLGKK